MRKSLVPIWSAAAILLAAMAPSSATAAADRPLTVVELFTSQGCSSCPPADAFLGELARKEGVLPLSMHVDYWDYIGWKDPYASAETTRRQRDYAARFGLRYVYTPQMVVHGAAQATGTNRDAILTHIRNSRAMPRVGLHVREQGGGVAVTVPAAEPGTFSDVDAADLVMVLFDPKHETEIKRGENRGRKLPYYNVVRSLRRIATWTGEATTVTVPASEMAAMTGEACAVLLQDRASGRILGAALLPDGS